MTLSHYFYCVMILLKFAIPIVKPDIKIKNINPTTKFLILFIAFLLKSIVFL